MTRSVQQALALLLVAALVPVEGSGQGRAPARSVNPARDKPADAGDRRAREVARLEAWLDRLPGQYEVKGVADFPSGTYLSVKVSGEIECVRIGEGVGVQCTLDVTWPTTTPNGASVPASPYSPAIVMYGFDPDAPGLHYLQVNNRSIAEAASGTLVRALAGDSAHFETPCVNRSRDIPATCVRKLRVTLKPDGVIDLDFTTYLDLSRSRTPYVDIHMNLVRRDRQSALDSRRRPVDLSP